MPSTPTDRTYPATRIIAGIVVPVLLLAFIVLYLFPEQSGERFAWEIRPDMSALYIGAGYLGGAFLLLQAALGRPWHTVRAGFPVITVFTTSMLAATLLHWERFDIRHFPFQLWLILYVVTPLLIPSLWLINRKEDPGVPEPGEKLVPAVARIALLLAGLVIGAASLIGWFAPEVLIELWVWQLTPLTARIFAGWFALLAAGGLIIGLEKRWSAWQTGLGSIFIWHLLVAIGAFRNVEDFGDAGLMNWYIILVWAGLAGMAVLFGVMTFRKS